MISILICSINPAKFAKAQTTYRAAMGNEPYELIGIHDARSLAEAYNRYVANCHGDIVVFSHEDVEVLSPQFPQRLSGHLNHFDLLGVAGTDRLVDGNWASAGPPHLFGQIAHLQTSGQIWVEIYGAPAPSIGGIQAIDSVWMAARRQVLSDHPFDAATFDGFHLCDLDWSFTAYQAGLRVGVANDINLLHASKGTYDAVWHNYYQRFMAKWAGKLSPPVQRRFRWAGLVVQSRQEALEAMTPAFWKP